ncbi:MAG TPA: helix-turn-helix transcriptional regulator [Bacillales bacterium]|nr:helix-turn-helix transcriptional regulator [Bacillales bacterium]
MIGENISNLRKQRGLTLSELAEKALISKSYLSNIERSLNKNPSIHVLEKIAGVLQVDLQKLIKSKKEMEESRPLIDEEWMSLVKEFKEVGIEKENAQNYKILFEFIKWQQEKNK